MATTNYNIRIDQDLRDRAFAVFDSYGLAPAQAIKLFLNQVADTKTVPLTFNHHNSHHYPIPNAETRRAIEDARTELATAKRYLTIEEAIQDIGNE